jgi:hypothetical protein
MKVNHMIIDEALKTIQEKHPFIRPNDGFLLQLQSINKVGVNSLSLD